MVTWRTPELAAAEARLAAAVLNGHEVAARAKAVAAAQRPTVVTDTELERAAADGPPALRKLAERVAAGDLTWQQIANGEAMSDPDVRAATENAARQLGAVYRQFEEGHTLDEVLGDGDGILKHSSW
ncbi:hypothetical protein [Actinokineospora sp. HUAS TT18]|uniref:hypothetical protein n=1 Tax=Actinokineospora sp. HUAS TT18 TaxID=3447451 RepID=UPI003F522AB1